MINFIPYKTTRNKKVIQTMGIICIAPYMIQTENPEKQESYNLEFLDKINLTRIKAIPYSGKIATPGCTYEQLLHSFEENSEEKGIVPKLMKAEG